MKKINQSVLAVAFGNPEPRREREYPSTWLLLVGDQVLEVVVTHDAEARPHLTWKEAA